MYLGDFKRGQSISFMWASYAAAGASITRATNGTISIYRDGNVTQFTAGITDTEDFDGVTGIHLVVIDTSNATNFPAGSDYAVVLSAAVIDGQSINAMLVQFSIENRDRFVVSKGILAAGGANSFTLQSGQTAGVKVGDVLRVPGKGMKFIDTYNSGTGAGTTRSNFGTTLAASDPYEVIQAADAELLGAADIATDAIGATQVAASAVTEIQTGLATATAIAALPTLPQINSECDTALADAGVTTARMGSLDLNFSIVGSLLTVRNSSGATLFTRNLATAARDALASAVPPP